MELWVINVARVVQFLEVKGNRNGQKVVKRIGNILPVEWLLDNIGLMLQNGNVL